MTEFDWPSCFWREGDVELPTCHYCGTVADDPDPLTLNWTEGDLETSNRTYPDYDSWYGLACLACRGHLEESAAHLAELGWTLPDPDPDREHIEKAVEHALSRDPLLARRMQPKRRPGGRWIVLVDDRVRARLRDLLRGYDVDWKWCAHVPYLRGSGRRETRVPAPVENEIP